MCLCVCASGCLSAPRTWLTLTELKDPVRVFPQTNKDRERPPLLGVHTGLRDGFPLHWSALVCTLRTVSSPLSLAGWTLVLSHPVQ